MNTTRIVRENVLPALAYWTIGLIGNYWISGVLLIVLFSPVHCLVLLILAITMPQKRPYWLAFIGVCLVTGIGFAILLYLSDISD